MDWTLDNLMWLRGKYHFPESQSFLWLINLKNSFWKWRMLLVTFLCWKHVVLKRQGYVLSWRDRHTSACPLDTRKGTACCSCPGIRGSEWRLGQRKGMFGRKQEIVKSRWGRPVGETQAGWERGNRPGLQEWGERTQPYKDSEARWGGEASGSVWGGSGSLQANQRDFRCQVHWGQGALELGRTRAEETSSDLVWWENCRKLLGTHVIERQLGEGACVWGQESLENVGSSALGWNLQGLNLIHA